MPSYRDDREALHARLEETERRLGEAQEELRALRGENGVRPEDETRTDKSKITGMPKGTCLRRELPFAVSSAGYEAIAAAYGRVMPHVAQASQIGKTLTIKGVDGTLTLRPTEAGGTTLTVDVSHSGIAFVQVALATLGTAFTVPFFKLAGLPPQAFVMSAPVIGAGSFWASRKLSQLLIGNHRDKLAGLVETAAAIAEEHREGPRVRVETTEANHDGIVDEAGDAERVGELDEAEVAEVTPHREVEAEARAPQAKQ